MSIFGQCQKFAIMDLAKYGNIPRGEKLSYTGSESDFAR